MEHQGEELLLASGVEQDDISYSRSVDVRYVGQGHEIEVSVPDGVLSSDTRALLHSAFERKYQALYGRPGPPVEIEVINWRVVASGPKPTTHLTYDDTTRPSSKPSEAIKRKRSAYFPETCDFLDTPVYDRYGLAPGMSFCGPAIIEERESTVIVGPEAACNIDDHFNLIVNMPQTDSK